MQKIREKYETEDFLTDESFIEWVKSENRNNIFWEEYCKKYPEQTEKFNQACLIINNLEFKEKKFNSSTVERIKQKIDWSIWGNENKNITPPANHTSTPKSQSWYYKIAASFIFIMLISYFAFKDFSAKTKISDTENIIEYNIKETQKGQKLTIYLHDGTKVKLNYESSLRFPQHFSDTNRIVYLTGEAFFEVAHDSIRPFKVITPQVTTKVLGTTFNINAYPQNETVDVALVSGKVAVTPSHGTEYTEPQYLNPGQAASFYRSKNEIKLHDFNLEQVLSWKDGVIVFNDANQNEVFSRLEKWYGLEFDIINSSNQSWRYTGKFDNLNLDAILTSLSFVKNFDYKIKNDQVMIRYNK